MFSFFFLFFLYVSHSLDEIYNILRLYKKTQRERDRNSFRVCVQPSGFERV
jgi:hypothetical protein